MNSAVSIPRMSKNRLWSLRLGYSTAQTDLINKLGIEDFIEASFQAEFQNEFPESLHWIPKTPKDHKAYLVNSKTLSVEERKSKILKLNAVPNQLTEMQLEKTFSAQFPLREKMVAFWHNHFVVSSSKVKTSLWILELNHLLRTHAFGNLREITKAALTSNALIYYLDNPKNTASKPNENLSRELLELFTLGIGNYSESDIKNGAKILSGLENSDKKAIYNPKYRFGKPLPYLGKYAVNDYSEMVDVIYEHPKAGLLIIEKLLQWFVCDHPSDSQISHYQQYLKKCDFELKPFLKYLFKEEFAKDSAGSKIKDPLTFIFQLLNDMNVQKPKWSNLVPFLRNQGYQIFNPPSVQGYLGGNQWLTSHILLHRNQIATALCYKRAPLLYDEKSTAPEIKTAKNDGEGIIQDFLERLISYPTEELLENLEIQMPHDWKTNAKDSPQRIVKTYLEIIKSPEFQLV